MREEYHLGIGLGIEGGRKKLVIQASGCYISVPVRSEHCQVPLVSHMLEDLHEAASFSTCDSWRNEGPAPLARGNVRAEHICKHIWMKLYICDSHFFDGHMNAHI